MPQASASDRIRRYEHDSPLGRWRIAVATPVPELAGMIDWLWYGEGHVNYARDRILPSAQSQLLINLGPTQYRIDAGPPERRVPFRDVWYSALHQSPIDTEAPHGSALLGIAFKSGGVYPWLGAALEGLGDRIVALSDLVGDSVLGLRQHLLDTDDDALRFELVQRWLCARLSPRTVLHPAVTWALTRIEASRGEISVAALATETGFSRKHLAALFLRQVGLAPKALARVQRFRAALALVQRSESMPWAELAQQCGYYDQSHLVNEFHALGGMAPGEFLRRDRPDAASVVLR
jgi:AraC-like DNA-binding protein